MTQNMFKIIGIETLDPGTTFYEGSIALPDYAEPYREWIEREKETRYQSVMRVLANDQAGRTYLFYRNYRIHDGRAEKVNNGMLPDDFFQVNDTKVSICAVVGKNGSGKSSLLDLMLRLLNNTAFALKEGIDNNGSFDLHFAECVFARLYFEGPEGDMFTIEQRDHDMTMSQGRLVLWRYNNERDEQPIWTNTTRRVTEPQCKRLLHRLFYTIMVNYSTYSYNITDYRSEWEDNNEKNTIGEHRIKGPEERKVTEEEALEPALKGYESDEQRCWIGALFHKNDAYQTPIVLNPFRTRGNIDFNREKALLTERLYLLLLHNRELVGAILDGKMPYSFVFGDEKEYLPLPGQNSIFYSEKVYESFDALKAFNNPKFDKNGHIVAYSRTQIPNQDKAKLIQETSEKIIHSWERCLGFRLADSIAPQSLANDPDTKSALNYIVYKTIKSTYYYSQYNSFQENVISGLNLEELVMALYCDTTHITLKLRRAIALLIFNHYHSSVFNGVENIHFIKLEDFEKKVKECLDNQTQIIINLKKNRGIEDALCPEDFEKRKLKPRGGWMDEELLPSASMSVTLKLKLPSGEEQSYDTLSSGEKQIIYTLGTTIYQLHHLNSVDETKIQYPCANLVFDEIDLYFHPEYQKKLVKLLLSIIGKMNLNVIKHINIIFATHSPFILSDIPQDNILYLEKGVDVSSSVRVNPLGANINDVLHHSFFLTDGFMGDYVKEKLLDFISYLKQNGERDNTYNWQGKEERMIDAIGEPFLKERLTEMYLRSKFRNKSDQVEWLQKKLNELTAEV